MERFLNNIEHSLSEEEGFSTVGVALALLISLALIFSAARVYEINSVSADIQEVADAAALAAENVVGEYCVVATLCDAIVLSLSLSSLCCLGLGVAAACTPVTAAASEALLKAARNLDRTRDNFSQKATAALEKLKTLLPLAAAAKAASVIEENSGKRDGVAYRGIAVLVPWQTEPLERTTKDKSDDAFSSVAENREELEKLGNEAEEAAREANKLKEEAYQADSGSEDAYCMYERAKNLAHLDGNENPYYTSSETWDFDVALSRAQAYYRARIANEAPEGNSTEEKARSALRKRFYQFASSQLEKGYVNRTSESFDAYFPLFPRNTNEMKGTLLYTEKCYPISTSASGKLVLHAFEGCPKYAQGEKNGYGSLAQMDDNEAFEVCESCKFTPASMGSVAAASSSIANGFEHHYIKVADLTRAYTEEQRKFEERSKKLKEKAGGLFDSIKEAFIEAKGGRIKIDPPGKYGAIAFVVTSQPGSSSFLSRFVAGSSSLSTRAAISGATLLPESTESGKTTINSILDGYADTDRGIAIGSAQIVLDLWSGLLKGYGEGQAALSNGLQNAIDSLPLASESGLGEWAAELFESSLADLGLEPADLSPQKAVLINTAHIVRADNSNFSARVLSIKEEVLSHQDADELFNTAVGEIEGAITSTIDNAEFTIEIASIEIIQGSLEIPITITLPQTIKDSATGAVQQGFSALKQSFATLVPDRRWQ